MHMQTAMGRKVLSNSFLSYSTRQWALTVADHTDTRLTDAASSTQLTTLRFRFHRNVKLKETSRRSIKVAELRNGSPYETCIVQLLYTLTIY